MSESPAAAPRFSLVTVTRDPSPATLARLIESVTAQSFTQWEWWVVDDASGDPGVADLLRGAVGRDPRIRLVTRETPGGPAIAANQTMEAAQGEFVVLVAQDQRLLPDALAAVNHWLSTHAPADVAYGDELVEAEGGVLRPAPSRPVWSPERLRSHFYTGSFLVIRRAAVDEVGGFRPELAGALLHDLLLRVTERTDRVVYVPSPMVAVAADRGPEPDPAAGARAVQEHCARVGIPATVEALGTTGHFRVRRRVGTDVRVSVVIPELWLEVPELLRTGTAYPNVEMIEAGAGVSVVERLHHGVRAATGQVLVLLDRAVAGIVTSDWIDTMLGLAIEPDCGVVGPRVEPGGDGPEPQVQAERSVVAGPLMLRREIWDRVGGASDEMDDRTWVADLCCKVRHCGYRVVRTPHAVVRVRDDRTVPLLTDPDNAMRLRWRHLLLADSYRDLPHPA